MSRRSRRTRWVAPSIVLLIAAGCGDTATDDTSSDGGSADDRSSGTPVIDPGDDSDYTPDIDPASFVEDIDNPYLPLPPGATWRYEATSDDGAVEVVEIEVTDERREVMGIMATVVRSTETVDGELVEDTDDWFAQDEEGNVWYMGEDTTEYTDGEPDTAGSWEAGVDGALPGIVMPADPAVGQAFRQEYYPDEAEDMGEVIRTGDRATVPAGEFDDLLVTKDWTPLEPDVVEEKYYARDVGLVLARKVAGEGSEEKLVSYSLDG